jgi:chromosome segregation ATPase
MADERKLDKEDSDDATWTEVEVSEQVNDEVEEVLSEADTVVQEQEDIPEEVELVEEEEEEPELEGIKTKGAEKRIRHLIRQRKERDEELGKVRSELNQLRYQMSEVGKLKFDYDDALATAKEGEISSKLESARNKFKDAYDAGNKDNVLEAQEELSEAQTDLKLLNQQKQWIKKQAEEYSKEQEKRKQEYENTSVDGVDPLAKEWAEKNKWFGKDRTRTAVALSIDAELKESGEDPSDPSFYKKVDIKLREELPDKYSEEATPSKPRQVVAGRSHSPASKNKVRLTSEDVRLAKKWSIPLERYAAEKVKADRADGDYTTVV